MGDFRIVIEGVGNHGCGRQVKDGGDMQPCHSDGCVDCQVRRFVEQLKTRYSCSVAVARMEHWPVPGAAGCTRTDNPGPIDDFVTNKRKGSF
jgi:hypothetical protein